MIRLSNRYIARLDTLIEERFGPQGFELFRRPRQQNPVSFWVRITRRISKGRYAAVQVVTTSGGEFEPPEVQIVFDPELSQTPASNQQIVEMPVIEINEKDNIEAGTLVHIFLISNFMNDDMWIFAHELTQLVNADCPTGTEGEGTEQEIIQAPAVLVDNSDDIETLKETDPDKFGDADGIFRRIRGTGAEPVSLAEPSSSLPIQVRQVDNPERGEMCIVISAQTALETVTNGTTTTVNPQVPGKNTSVQGDKILIDVLKIMQPVPGMPNAFQPVDLVQHIGPPEPNPDAAGDPQYHVHTFAVGDEIVIHRTGHIYSIAGIVLPDLPPGIPYNPPNVPETPYTPNTPTPGTPVNGLVLVGRLVLADQNIITEIDDFTDYAVGLNVTLAGAAHLPGIGQYYSLQCLIIGTGNYAQFSLNNQMTLIDVAQSYNGNTAVGRNPLIAAGHTKLITPPEAFGGSISFLSAMAAFSIRDAHTLSIVDPDSQLIHSFPNQINPTGGVTIPLNGTFYLENNGAQWPAPGAAIGDRYQYSIIFRYNEFDTGAPVILGDNWQELDPNSLGANRWAFTFSKMLEIPESRSGSTLTVRIAIFDKVFNRNVDAWTQSVSVPVSGNCVLFSERSSENMDIDENDGENTQVVTVTISAPPANSQFQSKSRDANRQYEYRDSDSITDQRADWTADAGFGTQVQAVFAELSINADESSALAHGVYVVTPSANTEFYQAEVVLSGFNSASYSGNLTAEFHLRSGTHINSNGPATDPSSYTVAGATEIPDRAGEFETPAFRVPLTGLSAGSQYTIAVLIKDAVNNTIITDVPSSDFQIKCTMVDFYEV